MTQRRDQVLVGFRCDPVLRANIEKAAGNLPLSQFLRDAVVAKLMDMGVPVEQGLADAPSRIGKGGRPAQKRVPAQKRSKGA